MFDTIFFVALFIAIAVLYFLFYLINKGCGQLSDTLTEARMAVFDLKRDKVKLETAIKVLGGRIDNLNNKEQRLVNSYIELKNMLDAVERKAKVTEMSLGMTDEWVDEIDKEATGLRSYLRVEIDPETYEFKKINSRPKRKKY